MANRREITREVHPTPLMLTQVLGLSYAQAAEVCGRPIGTIRSRVARACNDLMTADQPRRPGGLSLELQGRPMRLTEGAQQ